MVFWSKSSRSKAITLHSLLNIFHEKKYKRICCVNASDFIIVCTQNRESWNNQRICNMRIMNTVLISERWPGNMSDHHHFARWMKEMDAFHMQIVWIYLHYSCDVNLKSLSISSHSQLKHAQFHSFAIQIAQNEWMQQLCIIHECNIFSISLHRWRFGIAMQIGTLFN